MVGLKCSQVCIAFELVAILVAAVEWRPASPVVASEHSGHSLHSGTPPASVEDVPKSSGALPGVLSDGNTLSASAVWSKHGVDQHNGTDVALPASHFDSVETSGAAESLVTREIPVSSKGSVAAASLQRRPLLRFEESDKPAGHAITLQANRLRIEAGSDIVVTPVPEDTIGFRQKGDDLDSHMRTIEPLATADTEAARRKRPVVVLRNKSGGHTIAERAVVIIDGSGVASPAIGGGTPTDIGDGLHSESTKSKVVQVGRGSLLQAATSAFVSSVASASGGVASSSFDGLFKLRATAKLGSGGFVLVLALVGGSVAAIWYYKEQYGVADSTSQPGRLNLLHADPTLEENKTAVTDGRAKAKNKYRQSVLAANNGGATSHSDSDHEKQKEVESNEVPTPTVPAVSAERATSSGSAYRDRVKSTKIEKNVAGEEATTNSAQGSKKPSVRSQK